MPTIFSWTKETVSQQDLFVTPRTFHSIRITIFIPSENLVSTCTKELLTITSEDKEASYCKCQIQYSDLNVCDAGTNTIIVELQAAVASTQTKSTVSYSDASTKADDEPIVTPFSIETIKFKIGFPLF